MATEQEALGEKPWGKSLGKNLLVPSPKRGFLSPGSSRGFFSAPFGQAASFPSPSCPGFVTLGGPKRFEAGTEMNKNLLEARAERSRGAGAAEQR